MNPITGEMEYNGTSIIDITDPSKPTTKWHIPGAKGANHRSVSVVYDYKHDGSGNDYLIRSFDTGTDFRFQIFNITERGNKPESDRARGRDQEHAAEFLRPRVRRSLQVPRAQRLLVRGFGLLLRVSR